MQTGRQSSGLCRSLTLFGDGYLRTHAPDWAHSRSTCRRPHAPPFCSLAVQEGGR